MGRALNQRASPPNRLWSGPMKILTALALLLLMTIPALSHPLDALSTKEIELAIKALSAARAVDKDTKYPVITLLEPAQGRRSGLEARRAAAAAQGVRGVPPAQRNLRGGGGYHRRQGGIADQEARRAADDHGLRVDRRPRQVHGRRPLQEGHRAARHQGSEERVLHAGLRRLFPERRIEQGGGSSKCPATAARRNCIRRWRAPSKTSWASSTRIQAR